MLKEVNIITQEDQSVNELLNKTAKELHEKYTKQRKIKEKYLKKKKPIQVVLDYILSVVCVVFVLLGAVACFSSLNSSLNGCMPSYFGCTNMVIISESMVNSGFNKGDNVIVTSVDTNTLNVGDVIAFYVYAPSYINFKEEDAKDVSDVVSETKYSITPAVLFGFKNQDVKDAVKIHSDLVFHHIRAIYEDENGTRWFKTYGSSNNSDDSWYVKDTLVVGTYNNSSVASVLVSVLKVTSKPYGILLILVPAAVMGFSIMLYFLHNIQLAKLELDCVEEKRKITDPICVKNGVGYQMGNKAKYKILAQATDANREEYIKLLWKDGNMPNSVQKYYLRKKLLLAPNKDLLKLNRTCEQMFKRGEDPTKIANHYLTEKQKIEERNVAIKKRLKSIDKQKSEQQKQTKKKRK